MKTKKQNKNLQNQRFPERSLLANLPIFPGMIICHQNTPTLAVDDGTYAMASLVFVVPIPFPGQVHPTLICPNFSTARSECE